MYYLPMDERISGLLAYQKRHGLTNKEMSELLGAPLPQYYANWVRRNSLPKRYFEKADTLTGGASEAREAVESYSVDDLLARATEDQIIEALKTAKLSRDGAAKVAHLLVDYLAQ